MGDKDEDFKFIIFIMLILILLTMSIYAIKLRETSDKVDRLTEQIITEQTLEQPTTQATTEIHYIEPGDDEIVIDRGLSDD